MSNDFPPYRWQNCPMPVWGREQEFNEAFIKRVKRLREERGYTSEQMATALGIPAERYRKYEYRTPLPQYLIEQFAQIVDRDISYMLTGKGAATAAKPRLVVRNGTNN
jgi:transcriptional regulator with XRE-family HTH domain